MHSDLLYAPLVGMPCWGLAVWALLKAGCENRRADVVLARALEATGTLTSIDRLANGSGWVPTFAYRTSTGESEIAQAWVSFDDERKLGALGSEVQILYDPDDPRWILPLRSRDELGKMRRRQREVPVKLLFLGILISVVTVLALLIDGRA